MTKGIIYSNQKVAFGKPEIIGYGSDNFYIKEIDRKLSNKIIVSNHYSKKVFNNSYIHLGCFINNEILGVLQFGHLLNNLSVSSLVDGTKPGDAIELNRMWFDDIAERNTESMALSYSIIYIKNKYKKIQWIQSFADERCGGFGVVYQAANFCYYGEHISDFYENDGNYYHKIALTAKRDKAGVIGANLQKIKDNLIKHSFRQFRYIYFIQQRYKLKCKLPMCQYPKHYL